MICSCGCGLWYNLEALFGMKKWRMEDENDDEGSEGVVLIPFYLERE